LFNLTSYLSLQVVDALTDIVEGRTCDIILRDYSPVRSDSIDTASDSDESGDEMKEFFKFEEDELPTQSSESTDSNSISLMMHMNLRQPPSPPIQSISQSSSCSYKSQDESTSDGEAMEVSKSNDEENSILRC